MAGTVQQTYMILANAGVESEQKILGFFPLVDVQNYHSYL
jgi:hypothetical protein